MALEPASDLIRACRALERALRAEVHFTSLRVRIHRRDDDFAYDGPEGCDLGGDGASIQLPIRDARGIVGDLRIVDRCHRTCSGRIVHGVAVIAERHASAFRSCLGEDRDAIVPTKLPDTPPVAHAAGVIGVAPRVVAGS